MNEYTRMEALARDLAACYGKDYDYMDGYEKGFWLEPVQKMAAMVWDQGADSGEDNAWAGEHKNPYWSPS